MRKGSGTFFVYGRFAVAECNEAMKAPVGLSSDRTVLRSKMEGPRPDKFCGESTQSSKRAKAGYHHSGGALPFALHPPILCVSGQSLRTCVHGRYARTQEKGKVLAYRGVLSAGGMVYSAQQIGIWRYTMIIKIVTISLMAVFYICYFAKLISQKKQGIKTDQLGKGKEGFVKFIEVALKIITYLLPVIQIISIVFYSGTAHIVLQFTGVVITMFGVLAFIVSVTQMKENWRAGVQKEEKTNLVTTGIYSISRNPAFLGFDLMYIGILFSFFNWFLCFATGFAVVFFHLQIVNVEEDFLIEAFGNEYLQYKSKVCRYLGRKR